MIFEIGDSYMQINDAIIEIDPGRGTYPLLLNGRIMIPIRAVIEGKGGIVNWDENNDRITVYDDNRIIIMQIDINDYSVDGQAYRMDVKPFLLNDRAMLPLRFVMEGLGYHVEWIGSANKAEHIWKHK